MDLYREHILDHCRAPRGWGLLEGADAQGQRVNLLCGDEVTVQLMVARGAVTAMRFEGHGCAISRASASMLTEYVIGKTVPQLYTLSVRDIETLLGVALPPARVACGLLAVTAVQEALRGASL